MNTLKSGDIGKTCRFIGETNTLIYVGKYGSWHQFEELFGEAGVVWAEVLDEDLNLLEECDV